MGVELASVPKCFSLFTLSTVNISVTRGPITIEFNLKHHLGRGKAALGERLH